MSSRKTSYGSGLAIGVELSIVFGMIFDNRLMGIAIG
jgi:hypothetical protein